MTIAMLVSELLYSGKTLAEIAGYTTTFLNNVLLLPRDKWGKLIDPATALPPGVEVDDNGMRKISSHRQRSFGQSFRAVRLKQGLNEVEIQQQWEQYIAANPYLALWIEQCEQRKRDREQRVRNNRHRSKQNTGA